MAKNFFREFFDEFKLVLRAIPQGFKKVGVAICKGPPWLFKNSGQLNVCLLNMRTITIVSVRGMAQQIKVFTNICLNNHN